MKRRVSVPCTDVNVSSLPPHTNWVGNSPNSHHFWTPTQSISPSLVCSIQITKHIVTIMVWRMSKSCGRIMNSLALKLRCQINQSTLINPRVVNCHLRQTRLMWTPPFVWNHLTDGFQHQKLEHVSNCESSQRISNP